jgi:hypothetical protein
MRALGYTHSFQADDAPPGFILGVSGSVGIKWHHRIYDHRARTRAACPPHAAYSYFLHSVDRRIHNWNSSSRMVHVVDYTREPPGDKKVENSSLTICFAGCLGYGISNGSIPDGQGLGTTTEWRHHRGSSSYLLTLSYLYSFVFK